MARLTRKSLNLTIKKLIQEIGKLGGRKHYQSAEEAAKYFKVDEWEKESLSSLTSDEVEEGAGLGSGLGLVIPDSLPHEDQMKDTVDAMNAKTAELINPFAKTNEENPNK